MPAAKRPDGWVSRLTANRLLLAVLAWIGLSVMAVIALLGSQAAAVGGPAAQYGLPFAKGMLAEARLRAATGSPDQASEALARSALAHRPLSTDAREALIRSALARGDEALAEQLVASLERLAGRSVTARAMLFDWYFSGGDYADAINHADAMLRMQTSQAELHAVFNQNIANTPFRAALSKRLAQAPRWGGDYLRSAAETLDTPGMALLARDLAAQADTLPDALKVPLVAGLVARRLYPEAAALGGGRRAAIPRFAAPSVEERAGDPFAWSLPTSYFLSGDAEQPALQAAGPSGGKPAVIRTTLPAGRWMVRARGRPAPGWFGAMVCGGVAAAPVHPLEEGLTIVVAGDECAVQALSLTWLGRRRVAAPIAALTVVPVP